MFFFEYVFYTARTWKKWSYTCNWNCLRQDCPRNCPHGIQYSLTIDSQPGRCHRQQPIVVHRKKPLLFLSHGWVRLDAASPDREILHEPVRQPETHAQYWANQCQDQIRPQDRLAFPELHERWPRSDWIAANRHDDLWHCEKETILLLISNMHNIFIISTYLQLSVH